MEKIDQGRPTKYKKEYDKIAYEFISKGHTRAALAGRLNVNADTIYEWIKVHDSFSDNIKLGVAKALELYEQRLLGLSSGSDDQKLKKVNLSALIFLMKTRFHKDWGTKTEIQHSGTIDAKVIGDDQLKKMLKLIDDNSEE